MPAPARTAAGADASRKRRPHTKSRRGCRNCKLRRIKCDETIPKCKKCIDFGASCNYDSSKRTGDLELAFEGVAISSLTEALPPAHDIPFIEYHIADSLYPQMDRFQDPVLQLDKACRDRLARFQMRTVLSVGTTRAATLLQSSLLPMALSRPYLMHSVQTITAIEDRYCSDQPRKRSIPEIYHLSHAAAQFNQVLSAPLQESERDAIWTTAILLGLCAFAFTDASVPAESWPLKPADATDLEWLRMTDLKSSVYKLTNPLRAGGLFSAIKDEYAQNYGLVVPICGIDGIPDVFVDLFELDVTSSAQTNPYFHSLHILARLLRTKCTRSNLTGHLAYIMHMTPEYKRLISIKDPRALLMLAYWYGTVIEGIWWMSGRAMLECQATCLYLEKYHSDYTELIEMLGYPKMRCGLLASPGYM